MVDFLLTLIQGLSISLFMNFPAIILLIVIQNHYNKKKEGKK